MDTKMLQADSMIYQIINIEIVEKGNRGLPTYRFVSANESIIISSTALVPASLLPIRKHGAEKDI